MAGFDGGIRGRRQATSPHSAAGRLAEHIPSSYDDANRQQLPGQTERRAVPKLAPAVRAEFLSRRNRVARRSLPDGLATERLVLADIAETHGSSSSGCGVLKCDVLSSP
jgi:hypothetical protein